MTNARTLGNIGRNADLEDGVGLIPLQTVVCNNTFSAVDIALSSAYDSFILQMIEVRGANYTYTSSTVSEDGGGSHLRTTTTLPIAERIYWIWGPSAPPILTLPEITDLV